MAAAGETHALTKNQKRRLKKKLEKQQQVPTLDAEPLASTEQSESGPVKSENGDASAKPPAVEVEYVSLDLKSELALPNDDPAYEEFMRIFGKFSSAEELCGHTTEEEVRSHRRVAAGESHSYLCIH